MQELQFKIPVLWESAQVLAKTVSFGRLFDTLFDNFLTKTISFGETVSFGQNTLFWPNYKKGHQETELFLPKIDRNWLPKGH